MLAWFQTLTPEQQVGLITLILTLGGAGLVKGKTTHKKEEDEKHTPLLGTFTCGFVSTDHERLERLETSLEKLRETQIEILTLVRHRGSGN